VSLASPLWLLLLPLLPLAFWRRRPAAAITHPLAGSLPRGDRGLRLLATLPTLLRAAVLLLLVLAMARPRLAGGVVEERVEGVPIVLAVDVSSSMLAQDFPPGNRLDAARAAVARFLEAREGDPIAIVLFAGEALTQVPLTTDRRVLQAAARNIAVGMLEDGTAIGDGLATAAARLRGTPEGDRVVVLLSDGENNRGMNPEEAARAAAALGIRVFTVGVGSDRPAPVPVRGPEGFEMQELAAGLDEGLLRRIAATTGGRYFRADDPASLARVYTEIDGLVPSTFEERTHREWRELYPWLLFLAAGALLGEWALRASRWGRLP
jgi:Ca-activated chloride channel homolog